MAPVDKKRKGGPTNESFARARIPSNVDERPSKRPRPEEKEGQKSIASSKVAHIPKISKVREEEAAFPRGGASILTPLEHKQIQIEATRDVLFEQQGAKASKANGEDWQQGTSEKKSKSRSKPKKDSKVGAGAAEPVEEVVKIEGLSYKRIVPGSLVLGQVSHINDHDIALSLPNNLTGYVPITSISDHITARIEAIAAESEDDEDEKKGESEDVDLEKLFTIGQYLRAYVVSTSSGSDLTTATKSKRRIELSLRPQLSNASLDLQNVIVHSMLMASVISIEDHGIIMDIGLDSDTRGFMSSNEIGHGVELSSIVEGSVLLCMVTGLTLNGKVVKLSADMQKIGNLKKANYLVDAPTVDAFLPGTAVEILVADVTARGIAGKIMGLIDVTADLMHSGAGVSGKGIENKYKLGLKVKGRVICTFPASDPPKLGVSLLDHVVSLAPQVAIKNGAKLSPLEILPLSTIVEDVTVRKVEGGVGLFVDVGVKGVPGFVHISRVKDGKIETLSETTGPFKVGSAHRGRIIGYNSVDGVYLVSLEQSILAQAFLRIEDVAAGDVVKGKVEKIIVNAQGVGGILVNLAEGITGLVPESHMSDVKLFHPDKKFKSGMPVTVRVLSTDPAKRQIRLTLKKSLVNSEAAPFMSYEDIRVGMQSPGTIVNIIPAGAVVQFYGTVRGFLPVAEMSEAFIQDPTQHFRVGQVLNTHVLRVDAEERKMTVSCKDPSSFGNAQYASLKKLNIGEVVLASVTEKSADFISVELVGLGLRGKIPIGQLTDGTSSKNISTAKKIRVGQTLTNLVVLEKFENVRLVVLTNKPSLVMDAKDRVLIRSFDDVKENKTVHGFVKNITLAGVFVQFGGGLTGLLPKTKLPHAITSLPDFGMKRFQSVEARVISIDHAQQKFLLSMLDNDAEKEAYQKSAVFAGINQAAVNPIDDAITCFDDFTMFKLTKARVSSVKDTQINVQLADNIQGRIDVSQVFDSWDEIKDRQKPLKSFSRGQIVDVRVLGVHDARNHRFLPLSHRSGKTMVLELSAKASDQTDTPQEPLTLDKVKVGSSWVAFVNNVADDCLWVNLSPNVRGRISALDVSDDVSLLKDLETNFPIGTAVRVTATHVDVKNSRLDLSARSSRTSEPLMFENLSKSMVIPGRVTRSNERHIMVQLSDKISAPVNLIDLADDFAEANPTRYAKNDIIRVCIVDIDVLNKKLRLSTRPSKVLNSSLAVVDPEISTMSQVKVNDIVRGFVKNVTDKGLFVNLGGNVTAYVAVSNLSDSYLKEWQPEFEVDQLVKGKIILVDPTSNRIQMSLKASVMDKNYVPVLTLNDLKVGQIITGKVRKVEDFGVFIVVDNSNNVSGLCHQSEMAENRVVDVRKLYSQGDAVKAKVLRIVAENKRINFSLKASHFDDSAENVEDSEDEGIDGVGGVHVGDFANGDEDGPNGGAYLDDAQCLISIDEKDDNQIDAEMPDAGNFGSVPALGTGGFDWTANVLDEVDKQSDAGSDVEDPNEKRQKKRKKAQTTLDRTGDLDANGPQSASDFERLLLGQPDNSELWIRYMAFQLQLSEPSKARDVAERAIKTINIREDTEKLNVWTALLNLEVECGNEDAVEDVFKRACQYNDAQEVHERLASTYIHSAKHSKADDLFQVIIKKFSQTPTVWYNYAHFLHTKLSSPDRARLLLPRATQSLPSHAHLPLTLKFAALEFHSPSGSPERGRTIFEGILSTLPKRLDIWNQLIDLEIQHGDNEIVRGVFERVLKTKGIKAKSAKAWFRRWSEWEEKNGDQKSQEKVKAKAAIWVGRAAAAKEIKDKGIE